MAQVDEMDLDSPKFSITTTAMTDETLGAWAFGNPIRDQLNKSQAEIAQANSGLLIQNKNFQQASAGAGILRTLNQALKEASDVVEKNKVAATWLAAILGVVIVAKATSSPSGSRRR